MIPVPGVITLFNGRAEDCPSGNISLTQHGHLLPLPDLTPLIAKLGFFPDAGLPSRAGLLSIAPIMRNVPADTDQRHIPACRSADTHAPAIFGHNKTRREI
ncbi:hypothetical protein AH210_25470 [Salmonella enterica subsp. enterica serovar Newport]|nr:hypothetical protein [Salmonella enterica subsp. enterica serovar Newport]RAX66761.1 hypothetical protein CCZ16_07875 [Escherichia coli]